jgi:hypothetical protein
MIIPFSIIQVDDNGFHIMIKGSINGLVVNALIDSGATRSVMDFNRVRHYFEKVSLNSFGRKFAGVGTEKLETHCLIIPELCFGQYLIKDYEIVVINLEAINKTYAQFDLPRIDMVLGGDLLLKGGAIIDYCNKQLVFTV